ncbi:MAG: AMP-binding protein [Deltaproteobacteria bacterium]|nr:AMP-binding protein [Deltaproteobacteria bacterium]
MNLPAASIHSLEALMREAYDVFVSESPDPDEDVCLLYTSGTTAEPKGVRLSAENVAAEQEATEQALEIRPQDRLLGVLPFFHVFGLSNVLHLALIHGASVALVPQYSPAALLKMIVETRPTLILAIPTILLHLQAIIARKGLSLPQSVRLCVSGAAPLPAEAVEMLEETLGARVLEGYGLTETVAACCLNPPGGVSKAGSIGLPLNGFEMAIVDEQGRPVPIGQVGEIAVKGKGVTRGYFNLPDETRKACVNGWFLTGDLGYQDTDGYFFVTDRKKEIIVKAGLNISPREVEAALCTHPAVEEAAVVGRRKAEREEIVAFVLAAKPVSRKELISHCRNLLAAFKVPDVIRFRDTLPRSMTGKVLKRQLMKEADDASGTGPKKT